MADLRTTLAQVVPAADELGLDLFGAGTHPFASWTAQELTAGHRYEELIDRTQWWGRQMLIWGVHVHVGMPERERVLPVLSALLTYHPHLQALSASSPIWAGVDTGYASNRALMFQQLPTAGLPFQFDTWEQFEHFVGDQLDHRRRSRCSPRSGGTCGRPPTSARSRTGSATASRRLPRWRRWSRSCTAWSSTSTPGWPPASTSRSLPPWHVQENKWRAARYGLDAIVMLDAECRERLVTDDLVDLLERLAPVAERLGCAAELASVSDIVERGASYQRQRAVAERTDGDLVAVVDSVVRELRDSL